MRYKKDKMETEKQDRNEARKLAENISGSSWSGDDRTIVQVMIYKQLKRIADVLEDQR